MRRLDKPKERYHCRYQLATQDANGLHQKEFEKFKMKEKTLQIDAFIWVKWRSPPTM